MKCRIIIYYIAILIAIPSFGQDVKELQRQQRELQQQLEETSKMLQQTKKVKQQQPIN